MKTAVETTDEAIVSLLMAMDAAHGRSIVLHVGDVPYIVTDTGTVPFGSQPLRMRAAVTILEELLPADCRAELSRRGATNCDIVLRESPGRVYNIVAARGGDDIWIEIVMTATPTPDLVTGAPAGPAAPPPRVLRPSEPEDDWEPVVLVTNGSDTPSVDALSTADAGADLLADAAAAGARVVYGAIGRPLLARTDAGLTAMRDGTSLRDYEVRGLIRALSDLEATGAAVQLVTFEDQAGPGFTALLPSAGSAADGVVPDRIAALCGSRRGLLLVGGDEAECQRTVREVSRRAAQDRAVVIVYSSTAAWTDLPAGFVSVRGGIAPEFLAAALRDAVLQQADVLVVEDLVDAAVPAAIAAAEQTLVVASMPEGSSRNALARLLRSTDGDANAALVRDRLSDALLGIVVRTTVRGRDRERREAYELIDNGPRLAMAIGEGPPERLWRAALREKGTQTLEQSLLQDVVSGRVATREAYRRASDRRLFLRELRAMRRRRRAARVEIPVMAEHVAARDSSRFSST